MSYEERVFDMGRRQPMPQELTTGIPEVDDAIDGIASHPLDGDEARKMHKQALEWYYQERQRQAANRMEMALDHDFYDNMQWDEQDAADVRDRGQMPLVYNEVAPVVDWLIGTERRTRVDWKVLPRSEDDVDGADTKTQLLKFVADVNDAAFERSLAAADAFKGGIGWVEDAARDDPTEEILFSQREDWRNVLWDSTARRLDLKDARYLFRWRWVDEDVALATFSDRKEQVRRAIHDYHSTDESGETASDWYLGEPVSTDSMHPLGSGVIMETGRRRIRLIECQYRMPAKVQMVADGPMKGAIVTPGDKRLHDLIAEHGSEIVERVTMRVHFMVMTETDVLTMSPSAYRHNRFTLTPIWCYRRGRDRMPYGAIRRVRDIQQDLNKRASKALFLLNTNQVIADKGAVDDITEARAEADRPDGWIEKNPGKELIIRRDSEAANGQVDIMAMQAQRIQQSVGVNNENLGRQTNAISGAAISARQNQGSVSTTEPFDNLRMATKWSGEKQLVMIEQFYTEEKVVRITGAKGKMEWLKVNVTEIQPDGSVRYLNDVTASQADFVVSESDYAGTLRQVMFDSINNLAQRLPPEMAMRLFLIGMEFSDLPNKDEIVDSIRRLTGDRDPSHDMTPEESQQAQEQAQQQAETMQMQREQALLALEEQRAKVAKMNAEAQQISGGGGIQDAAAQQTDAMAAQLQQALQQAQQQIAELRAGNDVKLEVARIDADTKLRIAEIAQAGKEKMDGLMDKLEEMRASIEGKSDDKQPADADASEPDRSKS